MCNDKGWDWGVDWKSRWVEIDIDDATTREINTALIYGGGTAAVIGALTQAGIVTAPPGWLAALLTAVMGTLSGDFGTTNEGCGVVLKITQLHTGVTWYSIDPQ